MTEREKSVAAAVKTMFKDDEGNTWGFRVGPDGRAQRVLLGTKEGKTLDGEGPRPIIPIETAVERTVEEIDPAGLVSTNEVESILKGHFGAFNLP